MRENAPVEHLGRIEEITANQVRVGFVSHSSCSACHAKGVCAVSEVENKYVEVNQAEGDWEIGESVRIFLTQKDGFKALWYGYILPFFVLLGGLLICSAITGKEGLSGLVAIGLLIPYYAILYIYRENLRKKFHFIIKKID